jgi:putative dimethyl sulfoxide reductase chaperone
MVQHTDENWSTFFVATGLAYSFLSKVFYEDPASDFIGNIVAEDLLAEWPLESNHPDVLTGLHLMRDYLLSWNESQTQELQKDYNQLFIGPNSLPAPPWESVYRSPDRLMFEKYTLEVRQQYARLGLDIPKKMNEPDDHFGLEMYFIVHACGLGIAALEQGIEEQLNFIVSAMQDFFTKHLTQWTPAFLTDVVNNATTDYYRGAAYLASGCLTETALTLGVTPSRMNTE